MKDTSPEMDARYRDMLMQRSGEERLMMGCAMRETARALAEASILEQDLQATPEAVRKGLFLRFYGHEFNAESREKILAAIESVIHPVAR
jgi:predicted ABC-class ATPase